MGVSLEFKGFVTSLQHRFRNRRTITCSAPMLRLCTTDVKWCPGTAREWSQDQVHATNPEVKNPEIYPIHMGKHNSTHGLIVVWARFQQHGSLCNATSQYTSWILCVVIPLVIEILLRGISQCSRRTHGTLKMFIKAYNKLASLQMMFYFWLVGAFTPTPPWRFFSGKSWRSLRTTTHHFFPWEQVHFRK